MPLRFALPIGHPQEGSTAAVQQHVSALAAALTFDADAFSATHTAIIYRFDESGNATDSLKTLRLSFPASWTTIPGQMVQFVMRPATHVQLRRLLGDDIPTPMFMTLGPTAELLPDQSILEEQSLAVGSQIGMLLGNELHVTLQDQNGYYLNPLDYFQLFEQEQLWDLPESVRCPLIPATDREGAIRIAGPNVPQGPTMTISGGSKNLEIHNPPQTLPDSYFSFLANEQIAVQLVGAQTNPAPTLRLTNQCHQDHIKPADADGTATVMHFDFPPVSGQPTRWQFNVQSVMQPWHEQYTQGAGRTTASEPLRYQIQASYEHSSGSETRLLQIVQDVKDTIRQEYEFHRDPYQTEDGLPTPQRREFQPNVVPEFVTNFTANEFQRHNYGPGYGNVLRNAVEVYRVAEYMRNRNAVALDVFRGQTPPGIPAEITNSVRITSSWRNPERNENSNGVLNSNHQYGRALDLNSFHRQAQPARPPTAPTQFINNRPLYQAMFQAGMDFLDALIDLNGAARCASVEIILEYYWWALWRYRVSGTTTEQVAGSRFVDSVGTAATGDDSVDLQAAAAYATHVHVGWRPADGVQPLTLPALPGETS